jgi:hypothetical protein
MEPESSLPCSQDPSTGPYAELDQSSPYHPINKYVIQILKCHMIKGHFACF